MSLSAMLGVLVMTMMFGFENVYTRVMNQSRSYSVSQVVLGNIKNEIDFAFPYDGTRTNVQLADPITPQSKNTVYITDEGTKLWLRNAGGVNMCIFLNSNKLLEIDYYVLNSTGTEYEIKPWELTDGVLNGFSLESIVFENIIDSGKTQPYSDPLCVCISVVLKKGSIEYHEFDYIRCENAAAIDGIWLFSTEQPPVNPPAEP